MHSCSGQRGAWGGRRPPLSIEERARRLEIGRKIMLEAGGVSFTRRGFRERWAVLGEHSVAAADRVLVELLERGEVVQSGRVRTSGRGRPSVLYKPRLAVSAQTRKGSAAAVQSSSA